MKEINGDLLTLAFNGEFDVIIHGCNCFNIMSGGIAKQVRERIPEACEADLNFGERGDKKKLGGYSSVLVKRGDNFFTVINAYTQHDIKRKSGEVVVDYKAIRQAFKKINEDFPDDDIRFGYPAIGSGLAGGDWEKIRVIIEEELKDRNHTFVRYSS